MNKILMMALFLASGVSVSAGNKADDCKKDGLCVDTMITYLSTTGRGGKEDVKGSDKVPNMIQALSDKGLLKFTSLSKADQAKYVEKTKVAFADLSPEQQEAYVAKGSATMEDLNEEQKAAIQSMITDNTEKTIALEKANADMAAAKTTQDAAVKAAKDEQKAKCETEKTGITERAAAEANVANAKCESEKLNDKKLYEDQQKAAVKAAKDAEKASCTCRGRV